MMKILIRIAIATTLFSCTTESPPPPIPSIEPLDDFGKFKEDVSDPSSFASPAPVDPDGRAHDGAVYAPTSQDGVARIKPGSFSTGSSHHSPLFYSDQGWGYRYVKYDAATGGEPRDDAAFSAELCGRTDDGAIRLTRCGPQEIACPEGGGCSCSDLETFACDSKKTDSFKRLHLKSTDEITLEDGNRYPPSEIHAMLKELVEGAEPELLNIDLTQYLIKLQDPEGSQRSAYWLSEWFSLDTRYFRTDDGTLYGINFNFPAFANPVFKMNADRTSYYYLNNLYFHNFSPDYHRQGWDRRFHDHELAGIESQETKNNCILGVKSSCEELPFAVRTTLCYEHRAPDACRLLPEQMLRRRCDSTLPSSLFVCHLMLSDRCRTGEDDACRHSGAETRKDRLPLDEVATLCHYREAPGACRQLYLPSALSGMCSGSGATETYGNFHRNNIVGIFDGFLAYRTICASLPSDTRMQLCSNGAQMACHALDPADKDHLCETGIQTACETLPWEQGREAASVEEEPKHKVGLLGWIRNFILSLFPTHTRTTL